VDLARECLDKLVIDRHGKKAGRADGIVLELEEGRPPRVAFIDIGPSVQARRSPRWLAACVRWLIRKASGSADASVRVPFDKVTLQRNEVMVAIDSKDTPGGALERWLRDHVITRIPGA
jgi:hypothetical protein